MILHISQKGSCYGSFIFKYLPLNIAKCEKPVDMREKPVPVRVGKDLQPSETLMDVTKEEINFEKETCENASEDTISKELPSMVSVIPEVIPLNSTNESPSKYATRLYQTATEYRPSLDIPGEFEFLNSVSVSESQKQAVKFGVRVFRGTFILYSSFSLIIYKRCYVV